MVRMHPRIITALCLLVFSRTVPAHATLRVVATIFPLADMVRQVGGDAVEVATLLPPGASPHTFEPTPAQIRDIVRARVFVQVGAGLDTWTEKLLAARGEGMTIVTVTDGLPLWGAGREHNGEHHAGARGGDPHVWLDPVLVRDHLVPAIVRGLSQADPQRRADFERAAREYGDALTQLDTHIRARLAPLANRSYVAFHSAWRYFGARYGLDEVAVVESFPGKEPSAQAIASLVQQARAARVHALLIEPQFSPRLAEQIAGEFGGRVVLVDPLGGPRMPERGDYLDLMRYNAQAFAEALR